MTEDNSKNLFGLQLNETGIAYIRRLAALSGVIYFVVLLVSLMWVVGGISVIIENQKLQINDTWSFFRIKILPYFLLLTTIANLWGVYCYVKFFRALRKSIDSESEILFNQSFSWIYYNAIIFLIVVIMNLISGVLSLAGFL